VTTVGLNLSLVLVIVAIDTQKFPIAAVGRIVVVIVVAMVHRQFPQICHCKFTGATAANPRINFQGAFSVAFGTGIGIPAGIEDYLVETLVVDGTHWAISSWREKSSWSSS